MSRPSSKQRKAFLDLCDEYGYTPGRMMIALQQLSIEKGMEWLEAARKGQEHPDFPGASYGDVKAKAFKELASALQIEKELMAYAYAKPRAVEVTGKDGGPVKTDNVWRVEVVDADPSDPGEA